MLVSSTSAGCGPQLSLVVARIVPANADSFEHVWSGNLDAVKILFSNRAATPRDVDDMDGGSYLNYALRSRKFDMSKFLLELPGTNASLEDQFGESPIDVAWQLVLSRKTDPTFDAWLRSRMAIQERLRGRHLTTIHKIICGLCKHDLEQELETSTAEIDTPDAGGWTPLIWAAYCQSWSSVLLLLKYGADANIANRKGQLALHHACREGLGDTVSSDCLYAIGCLATATADINRKDVYGDTALMYAAEHNNDPRILETLHKAGASLSETDLTGHSALHNCIYFDNARAVETLARLGADINRTSSGDTPLMKTIICNAHNCMRTLLRLGANTTTLDLEEHTIIHLAGLHADAKTLWGLASAVTVLGCVDPSAVDLSDQTADGIFWTSRLVPRDEEAQNAWTNLMSLAQVEWKLRRDSELEKLHESWASMENGDTDSSVESSLANSIEIYHDAAEIL
ncbi:ankyrin repeat-containing domain protein [Clohesyomyces aquaticus]|uniref:Ankyrin repeat-containing domain protein n=1 Tax=Clohesyomyces aquaticus TaxID=1231657 RepID=A0A1Y2A057_9PLEO|nr:ankyrin repeat-containing domain protein [Clohesyomyces aquaticus]